MNKLLTSCIAASLGLIGLVSCGNQNGGDTVSSSEAPSSSSSSSVAVTNEINMKKAYCYIDGLNKKLDLVDFFEFKGNVSIDDLDFLSMDLEEDNKIISLSGHEVTSLGYGDTTLLPDLKKGSSFVPSFQSQTIYIRVLNPKDIVHTFASNNEGTSTMSFEIKEDETFLFSRSAGTLGNEVNVKEAQIEGTYKLGKDGVFLFTPKTSDYCTFKAVLNYDKKDGSEFHLNVFSPLNEKDVDLNGVKFSVTK